MAPRITLRIQSEPFDTAHEIALLSAGGDDAGAVTSFVGLCRSENGRLKALELEHYPGMADEEIARVVAEAETRWPLDGVTVIHRVGKIAPGARIVLVVTASAHRAAAFAGAEFLMDYLKTRAPFWKLEERGAGSTWVEARSTDDESAKRWR